MLRLQRVDLCPCLDATFYWKRFSQERCAIVFECCQSRIGLVDGKSSDHKMSLRSACFALGLAGWDENTNEARELGSRGPAAPQPPRSGDAVVLTYYRPRN